MQNGLRTTGDVLRVAVMSRELRPGIKESLKRFGAVLLKVEKDLGESLGARLLEESRVDFLYLKERMFLA